MRIEEIKVAQNGFVLEDDRGNLHVAKTLTEAAQLAGELPPLSNGVVYAPGVSTHSLLDARREALAGNKINAIKILRDSFTARLGLREAKDIVEVLILGGM